MDKTRQDRRVRAPVRAQGGEPLAVVDGAGARHVGRDDRRSARRCGQCLLPGQERRRRINERWAVCDAVGEVVKDRAGVGERQAPDLRPPRRLVGRVDAPRGVRQVVPGRRASLADAGGRLTAVTLLLLIEIV